MFAIRTFHISKYLGALYPIFDRLKEKAPSFDQIKTIIHFVGGLAPKSENMSEGQVMVYQNNGHLLMDDADFQIVGYRKCYFPS